MLRELRRWGGRVRDSLLYGRRNRRLAAEAAAMRGGWIEAAADALPPLPDAGPATVEVHTMCGTGQVLMGIWSSYSLMRFLPGARLVVHDDGTLARADVERWRRAIPGLAVIAPEAARAATAAHLARFPHVRDWSLAYHFGPKLGGFQAALRSDRLIDADTDTLTLAAPTAALDCLDAPGLRLAWNRDSRSHYAYPERMLREILGDALPGPLPEALNGGFMVMDRLAEADWATTEAALVRFAADPRADPLRYWMHQTLIAILAARLGDAARPLPEAYEVHHGPTRPDAAMRHYVGNPGVRPRFFTEGVPAMIRNARALGQLPARFALDAVPYDGPPPSVAASPEGGETRPRGLPAQPSARSRSAVGTADGSASWRRTARSAAAMRRARR
jgi:hypothetical protein